MYIILFFNFWHNNKILSSNYIYATKLRIMIGHSRNLLNIYLNASRKVLELLGSKIFAYIFGIYFHTALILFHQLTVSLICSKIFRIFQSRFIEVFLYNWLLNYKNTLVFFAHSQLNSISYACPLQMQNNVQKVRNPEFFLW